MVPDTQQLPHVLARCLMLNCLREERDEVRGAEVATVHADVREMAGEVGEQNRNQAVKAIEVEFEHGQICIEQCAQLVHIYNLAHDCES